MRVKRTKKILLTADLPPLGFTGDVVEVKEGYARNFLIPFGYATEPTKENLKRIEKARKEAAEKRAKLLAEKKAIAERINDKEFTITATANEQGHLYGSIGPKEIAEALSKEGYNITEEEVRLKEHIKEVGEYKVDIVLAPEVKASIIIIVKAKEGPEAKSS